MTDYSQMTAAELRRAVAERLGWRVEIRKSTSSDPAVFHFYAALLDVSGKEIGGASDISLGRNPIPDIDTAWWLLDENGYGYPDWPRDADAALALPLKAESWFELVGPGWNNTEWGCRVMEHDVPKEYPAPLLIHHGSFHTADTPALAVVRAWLDWSERGGAGRETGE